MRIPPRLMRLLVDNMMRVWVGSRLYARAVAVVHGYAVGVAGVDAERIVAGGRGEFLLLQL